jgi:uncharacterized protein
MMQKVELNIIALSASESQPNNFVVILEEIKTLRRLPIIIGITEAQAIAVSLEKMQPHRPLTHDIFKDALDQLKVKCLEIVITELKDDVFYSKIILETAQGQIIEIDSRTSDAIAMAVRCNAPIFVNELILDQILFLNNLESKIFIDKKGSLDAYTLEQLEHLLERVLEKEDYESAGKIRAAIDRKK